MTIFQRLAAFFTGWFQHEPPPPPDVVAAPAPTAPPSAVSAPGAAPVVAAPSGQGVSVAAGPAANAPAPSEASIIVDLAAHRQFPPQQSGARSNLPPSNPPADAPPGPGLDIYTWFRDNQINGQPDRRQQFVQQYFGGDSNALNVWINYMETRHPQV